jgi:ribosomal protein S18 acetylase RimI-like enzyme
MASSRRTRSPDTALRRARLADAPALARVMRAAIRGLARGAYPAAQVGAWSSLPAAYHAWAMTAGGETVWIAERSGRIVGYAALRRAEVTALFVLPSAGRRGIGTALLAAVERAARRRGIRRLVLRASLNGLAFYRAHGFTGRRPIRVPLPDGAHLDAVALAKTL